MPSPPQAGPAFLCPGNLLGAEDDVVYLRLVAEVNLNTTFLKRHQCLAVVHTTRNFYNAMVVVLKTTTVNCLTVV